MSDSSSSPRPRRPLARPGFDPATQPWVVANASLPAVPASLLTPDSLRGTLSQPSTWTLELSRDTDLRYPGREGVPVPAAVLIPLVTRDNGVHIMLTQRAAHLHDHAGQISFPGGRIETSDSTPEAAALREAQEETGLPANHVEVLGSMPPYLTATGFSIVPVVSLVRPGFDLAPDAFEVAEVFEVPLSFLMDPANHRLYEARLDDGRVRQYYGMPYGKHFIWGATAGMLRNLYHLLRHGFTPRIHCGTVRRRQRRAPAQVPRGQDASSVVAPPGSLPGCAGTRHSAPGRSRPPAGPRPRRSQAPAGGCSCRNGTPRWAW